jgi:hypothetical protein
MNAFVIRKRLLCIAIGVALASCDKPGREADRSETGPETNPRTKRLERPPLASQGTRGGLRASLDAARALGDPEERQSSLMEVGWKALETAPDLAAEVIREMPHESADAARLIQACVTHLMKNSPDEASAWADSLKDAPWIALAREQIAMLVAESDPKRAIQLLTDSNQSSIGEPGSSFEQVLQTWTGQAPGEAALWASRLPAGESRNAGIKTVMSQWLHMDAAASTAWVASLTDSKLRQESIRIIAESLREMPPFLHESILNPAESGIRGEIESEIELQKASIESAPEMLDESPTNE